MSSVEVSCPLPKLDRQMYPTSVSVRVASAELTKKVAPGDELVLYIPAKPKKVAGKFLDVAGSPVKKSKMEEKR